MSGPPLSFAQQRLWFLREFETAPYEYNVPIALRMRGALDPVALRAAVSGIVARHTPLRTTFHTVGGVPVPVVAPLGPVGWCLVDLRNLGSAAGAEADRLAVAQARIPFDLATDSPMRTVLFRIAERDHLFAVTVHHIAFDAWSANLFATELGARYTAAIEGRTPDTGAPPFTYSDYAASQQRRLDSGMLDRHLAYWCTELRGLAPTELPSDRPRPPVRSGAGACHRFTVGEVLTRRLRELGTGHRATLFMTLLAAYAVLLHRLSARQDIAVATLVANRMRPDTELLIGCFTNTVVLRTDLSGEPSFVDLLSRVRRAAVAAYAHQELPFDLLVRELRPERDPSRPPLAQVAFGLESAPDQQFNIPGLAVEAVPLDMAAHFDLDLTMSVAGDELHGSLGYSKDLFDSGTAAAMVTHYRRLLEAVVADPNLPITQLPLLTDDDERLRREWQGRTATADRGRCLHELIADRSRRHPDATALECGEDQVSYAELDTLADQLAARLCGAGVGPEDLVAVSLERSVDMVIALLATLKSGAAYVPLDPTDPAARLTAMLTESGAAVLLTRRALVPRLPRHPDTILIDEPAVPASPGRAAPVHPDNAACAIFTSGSTGVPKAAVLSHRAIVNFALALADELELRPTDRFLQLAPLGFDVLAEELFPALLRGACIVIPPDPDAIVEPAGLVDLIDRTGVTLFEVTVPHWQALVRTLLATASSLPPSVRLVLTGGERASADVVEAWDRFGIPLVHVYGLTEAACTSTLLHVRSAPGRPSSSPLPIGYAIANTTVHVLDSHLGHLPVGVPGELHVGGVGLARCYLDRPGLTADRFVPDPFADVPGARLYRTGDLARHLPDGALVFLGRRDHQVKIRGHRIELGEVEASLSRHPRVEQVVVLCREDRPSDKRLVAYVVAEQPLPGIPELRAHLKAAVPDYMVPATFVFLDRLPLTPSGKLDRLALPKPTGRRPALDHAYAGPADPVEELVVRIWTEVLQVDRIGTHDNFFDLGGHSLSAIQVVTRLQREGGAGVTLRTLFELQTPSELAQFIGRKGGAE